MAENYDVVVIGAGPGGYVAAIRAAQLGQKTAIVDKQWLGGVCLNVGCIPSKSLLKNAEVAHTLRERGKELGFSFENLKLDFGVAVKRSRQVSDRLVKGVGFLMKKNNIAVYMGTAKLTAKDTVAVTDKDGKLTELKAKNIIVATGATSAVPAFVYGAGMIVVILGLVAAFGALRQMIQANTSPDPHTPTTSVVTTGVYRFTRNPIYVGYL
jgi:dihydrolipoamide dehydrogenase